MKTIKDVLKNNYTKKELNNLWLPNTFLNTMISDDCLKYIEDRIKKCQEEKDFLKKCWEAVNKELYNKEQNK